MPLSEYVETYLSEMVSDADYRKMFDLSINSEIKLAKLNLSTIVRLDNLNSRFEVDPGHVESLAWSIYINGYRDDRPLWVGIIEHQKYIIWGHNRHAALALLRKDKDAFPKWDNPKIPCLVKSMTRDDFDRLSSLIALDSPQGELTQAQHRDACVNLLTYPHYWILTDIELAKKWGVKYSTVNRWRKRARELLRDDDGQISADRKTIMEKWILSRERLLEETDENGNRKIRRLAGAEPPIDPIREIWSHEAYDFTRWLEKNIGALNDTIGLSLSNVRREQAAGDFSVDLVAEDESGNLVVIENQLEQSDHKHLGQLITYLTKKDAKAAIWIVKEARPEHIKAIDWLNKSPSASFYLIKIKDPDSIRNASSAPLTVIVDPSGVRRETDKKKDPCQLEIPSLLLKKDSNLVCSS